MRDDERLRKHSLDKTLPPVVLPKPRRSSAESKREIFARNRSLTTPTSPTANFFGDSSVKDRKISSSSNSNEPLLEEMKEEVRIEAKTDLADEVFDGKIGVESMSEPQTETTKTDSVDQPKIEKQEILDTSVIEEAIEASKMELASDSNKPESNCLNTCFVSDSEFNTEAKAMTEDIEIAKSKTKEGLRKLSDAIDELENLTFESIDNLTLKEESTEPEESNKNENKLLDEQIRNEGEASNDKFIQDTKEPAKINLELKPQNTEEDVKGSLNYEGVNDSTEANAKIKNVAEEMQVVDDEEVVDDYNLKKECESVESDVNSGNKDLETKTDNEGERKQEEPENLVHEEVVDGSNLKKECESVESDINSGNQDLEIKTDNEGERKQEEPKSLVPEEVADGSNLKKECESVESDINSGNKDLETKIDNEGERKQEEPEILVHEEVVDGSNLKKECESVESDINSGNQDLEIKTDNEGERKQEEPKSLVPEEVADGSNLKKECESVESDVNSCNKDLETKVDNEGKRKQEQPENVVQEEVSDGSNLKKECECAESDVDSGNKDMETKIENEGERKQGELENLVNTCIVEVQKSNKPENKEEEGKTEENDELNPNCDFLPNDVTALHVSGSPVEILPSKKEAEISTIGPIVGTVEVNHLMDDVNQEKFKESEVDSSPRSTNISKELHEGKGELHTNLNYEEGLDKKEELTDKMNSNLEKNESSQKRDESSERESKFQSPVESLNESNNSNDVSQQSLEVEKDKKVELGEIQNFNQNENIALDTDTKFNEVDHCVGTNNYEKLECKSETVIVETFGEKQELNDNNNNNNNNNEISRISVEIEI